jgi:hypothetical protein
MSKKPKTFIVDKSKADQIFDELEADLPEDLSGLSFDGRNIEPHGRQWLDDDGR